MPAREPRSTEEWAFKILNLPWVDRWDVRERQREIIAILRAFAAQECAALETERLGLEGAYAMAARENGELREKVIALQAALMKTQENLGKAILREATLQQRVEALTQERDQALGKEADAKAELAARDYVEWRKAYDSQLSARIESLSGERNALQAALTEAQQLLESLPTWGTYSWQEAAASVKLKLKENTAQIVQLIHERDALRQRVDELEHPTGAVMTSGVVDWQKTYRFSQAELEGAKQRMEAMERILVERMGDSSASQVRDRIRDALYGRGTGS